jgi:hypothetical protein
VPKVTDDATFLRRDFLVTVGRITLPSDYQYRDAKPGDV